MNIKPQFTPGPWKLPAGVIGADKVWSEDQNGNETLIARGIENEHDARLISLAPEMFAALESAAAWADSVPSPYREFPFVVHARSILSKLNS